MTIGYRIYYIRLMSQKNRLDFLNENEIIYRRDPITDLPSEVYDWGSFYEDGTNESYKLFHSKAQITSYKSLKWHLHTLYYLNNGIDEKKFIELCNYLTNRDNGFITYTISRDILSNIIEEVLNRDNNVPTPNKPRKVLFKDGTGLTVVEKLKIVGSLIGRNKNVTSRDIYEAMLYLSDCGVKITNKKLSLHLNVSERTILRNMDPELKKEKNLLNKDMNEKLQRSELCSLQV
ncbi:MAG: hypothetical protein ACO3UU_12900 [Minisyncoccia bacterium]